MEGGRWLVAREQARARQEMQLSPGEVGRGAELMQRVTSTPPHPPSPGGCIWAAELLAAGSHCISGLCTVPMS